MSDLLDAALMLANRGLAVHYLRPQSKIPIDPGWSTRPVATPNDLKAAFYPRCNVGVRCGHWSKPEPGYGLLIIDKDVRDLKYRGIATATVESLLPECIEVPVVLSGGGNSSAHFWLACPLDDLPNRANVTIA